MDQPTIWRVIGGRLSKWTLRFGHLVLRFHHGEMSQAELGQHIGATWQTIAAIEAAFRIARVFDVPLGEVFQWDPDAV